MIIISCILLTPEPHEKITLFVLMALRNTYIEYIIIYDVCAMCDSMLMTLVN